ncbi:hypothetical protein LPJ64_003498 [Coemansia asiatica]|uniref:SANT domain-containing protein n=1 Tax=Coemansia asiatica TaxID=1052880 RepID=A0A9W8CJI1_9FUNG|nr:hypothetical protein LPJ64_003498 [Coemansia asiatica]
MAAVTSSRVSKGTSKFVPKAKPRATRRAEQLKSSQRPARASSEQEEQQETEDSDRSRQQNDDAEEAQVSDSQRVPDSQPLQTRAIPSSATAIGIPSIVSTTKPASFASIGIPAVGSTTTPHRMRTTAIESPTTTTTTAIAAIAAGGVAAIVQQSSRRVPPRLNIHSHQSPSAVGSSLSGAIASVAPLPRLASLSSPISPQSASTSRTKRTPRSRVTSPLKRPRTASKTPEPRPMLQLKTEDDYSCLSLDEINNLPMAYFCRDTRHGRPTAEFIEKENEFIRKVNAHAEGKPPEQEKEKEATPAPIVPVKKPESAVQPVNRMAAQVRIVDGKVVVDTESLVINRRDMAGTSDEPLELIDESTRQRFTNSLTYVPKRTSRKRWSKGETELFYDALRKYGTDFNTIASVLPNRNRYDVRNKFKAEEKIQASRITVTLLHRDRPVPSPLPVAAQTQELIMADGLPASLESYSMATTPNPNPNPDAGGALEMHSSEAAGDPDDEPLPEPSAVVGGSSRAAPRTRPASLRESQATRSETDQALLPRRIGK